MKTMIGLATALMLGAAGAYAQGGPGENMQGPSGVQEQGPSGVQEQGSPAPDISGGGGEPGRDVQQRAEPPSEAGPQRGARIEAEPRSESRGEAGPKSEDRIEAEPRSANRAEAKPRRGDRVELKSRSKTDRNGSGQVTRRSGEDEAARSKAQKDDQPKRADTDDKSKKTDDRGDDQSADKAKSASEDSGARGDRDQQSQAKKDIDRKDEPNRQASTGDRKEDARHVELSGDKRDRVKTAFRDKGGAKHRTNVNIHLSIGTRLPRDWDLVPVPIVVIEIVPEYRGYLFAYVDDDYVICEPDTYEIVAVIPASGGASYAREYSRGECSSHISLNEDERDLIIDSVRREDMVDVSDLTIGWSVPRDIELLTFPDPVLSRAGELSPCRYFVAENQIAIVDPEDEKVVLLIDWS